MTPATETRRVWQRCESISAEWAGLSVAQWRTAWRLLPYAPGGTLYARSYATHEHCPPGAHAHEDCVATGHRKYRISYGQYDFNPPGWMSFDETMSYLDNMPNLVALKTEIDRRQKVDAQT